MKFRKKPVIVEAFKYDGDLKDRNGLFYVPFWAQEAYKKGIMYYGAETCDLPPCELYIETLEGTHHVSVGDYVIQGVNGELYPCKPDIFEKTYEEVKEVPTDALAMGNLDPVSLFKMAGPETMKEATLQLLEATRAYPNFVLSSGCDIPPLTPSANIDAFYAALEEFNNV